MKRLLVVAALLLASCDELGNPTPRTSGQLVTTTETSHGRLTTEARLVGTDEAQALVAQLGSQLDHVDTTVPSGGSVVAVIVTLESRGPRPSFVHLVTDLLLPGGVTERRVWVARGEHARFIALFGVRATPIDVRTSTM